MSERTSNTNASQEALLKQRRIMRSMNIPTQDNRLPEDTFAYFAQFDFVPTPKSVVNFCKPCDGFIAPFNCKWVNISAQENAVDRGICCAAEVNGKSGVMKETGFEPS